MNQHREPSAAALPGRTLGWVRRILALCLMLLGSGLATGVPVLAQSQSFTCPQRISTLAASAADATVQGFAVAFQPDALAYLLGVAVFDGPAEEGVEIPAVGGASGQLQWKLDASKRAAFAVCRYEGGILLSRVLGKSLRQCVATIKRSDTKGGGGFGLERAAFACQ